MRFFTLFLFLGATLFLSTVVQAQQFVARLSGSAEVLPVATTGAGTLDLDLNGTTLVVTGSFRGLTSDYNASVGMHLHTGRAGENGPIMVSLTPVLTADRRGGTLLAATNTFTLTAEQVTAIKEGRVYANIHTGARTAGEIRGQVLRANVETFLAVLGGSNELPANTSTALGAVVAELDGLTLRVSGMFDALSAPLATSVGGGAHLHIGGAGESGPVAFPLTVALATGGQRGSMAFATNTFTLTAEQAAALRARRMYVNIHSTRYPAGEIRGQLAPTGRLQMTALLTGSQEVPAVTTPAMGNTLLELDGDTLYVSGGFSGLQAALNTAIAGGAHLHTGMAGTNGSVAFALATTAAADGLSGTFAYGAANRFVLSAEQKTALIKRGLYVNVHSLAHASGEVRGQVIPPHVAVFVAPLMGMNETPAVGTPALGNLVLELDASRRVVVTGGFSGLRGALNTAISGGVHMHAGLAGQNGSVEFSFSPTVSADGLSGTLERKVENTFVLNPNGLDAIMARAFYVNVHSTVAPSGEIRGQIVPAASALVRATLSGTAEVPAVATTGHGTLVGEIVGDSLFVSGAFTNLTSNFDASVGGGAHLHDGDLGANGSVVFALNTTAAADLRSGTYAVAANRFGLTAAQKARLLARGLYANVHTTAHASGEIRGQMTRLADAVLETRLQGSNETNFVMTPGSGGAVVLLTDTTAIVAGQFGAMTSSLNSSIAGGAHLHAAAPGADGPIAFSLSTDLAVDGRSGVFPADRNRFGITSTQRADLLTGQYYINLHSLTNPTGELRGQLLASANLAPPPAAITSPANGTAVTVQASSDAAFRAEWSPVSDPNANTVVYRWQLATNANFSGPLVDVRTGTDTAFETTFGAVDALLASAGVAAGGTITLYHRVIASDGSTQTPGDASEVDVTRGTGVAAEGDPLPQVFALRGAYPNPTHAQTGVRIDLDQASDVQVFVFDVLGREVARVQQPAMTPGAGQVVALDLGALAPGTYVYRVTATRAGGTVADTGTLTIVR